jgi:hypothetical protein
MKLSTDPSEPECGESGGNREVHPNAVDEQDIERNELESRQVIARGCKITMTYYMACMAARLRFKYVFLFFLMTISII